MMEIYFFKILYELRSLKLCSTFYSFLCLQTSFTSTQSPTNPNINTIKQIFKNILLENLSFAQVDTQINNNQKTKIISVTNENVFQKRFFPKIDNKYKFSKKRNVWCILYSINNKDLYCDFTLKKSQFQPISCNWFFDRK